jgi:hypothetical protein
MVQWAAMGDGMVIFRSTWTGSPCSARGYLVQLEIISGFSELFHISSRSFGIAIGIYGPTSLRDSLPWRRQGSPNGKSGMAEG